MFRQSPIVLALATVSDSNFLGGLATLGSKALDLLDNVHTLDNLSEDDVLAIQPLGLSCADEKLGAIGVGSSISHGENSYGKQG